MMTHCAWLSFCKLKTFPISPKAGNTASIEKETIDGEKTVQKSDDLILCLVQTPKNSPLPNGAYERVSYTGQLYADGDNKFVQLITDSSETTEKTYSYDDIKKMTE